MAQQRPFRLKEAGTHEKHETINKQSNTGQMKQAERRMRPKRSQQVITTMLLNCPQ